MLTLSIREEVFGSKDSNYFDVTINGETLTLSELIQAKVSAKVFAINSGVDLPKKATHFIGKVERMLNQDIIEKQEAKRRDELMALKLDAEKACYDALAAFQRNAFFVLVDGEQKTELEEKLILTQHSQVNFIRLTPLMGG